MWNIYNRTYKSETFLIIKCCISKMCNFNILPIEIKVMNLNLLEELEINKEISRKSIK